MGLVVILSMLFSLNVEAKTCRLPNKPVHDQDGLGSCYANTISLMMEHNLKLPKAPSYYQMSLSASAHRGTFMYTDKEGNSDIFNSGGWTCATYESANKDGFCDAQTFRWDAIGTVDPQQSQENFLKALGTLIDHHREELRTLSNAKKFSVERQQIERQLAGIFQQKAQLCQVNREDNVCREDEAMLAVRSLLFLDYIKNCGQIPSTIEPRHEQMAHELLAAIQLASRKGESGLRGLVNLISPSCGAEMSVRKGKLSHECDEQSIKDDISALAAAKTIEDEICGGRSVGISLCTGFFISTTPVDSGYCSQDVPGIEQHGRHAVALVGVKNNAIGEREFLIQNSWGRTCPFLQHKGGVIPDALKGLVQCEMTKGVPTGRFWVNEKLLMNNSYAFQVLK